LGIAKPTCPAGFLPAWRFTCSRPHSIGYNATPSLPFKLFLIHYHEPVSDGDYIAFRWHGGKPYPDGMVFAKRVVGMAGDNTKPKLKMRHLP